MTLALPDGLPFSDTFARFLADYEGRYSYWYVPKTRVLDDNNARVIQAIVMVLNNEFAEATWTRNTQDELLVQLRDLELVDPYREGNVADRTALSRIWMKLLKFFGLVWVADDHLVAITEAGIDLITTPEGPESVLAPQVAKLQYPSPHLPAAYRAEFAGILPHLFLLQVLQKVDYVLFEPEYELFVNLAQNQADVERVTQYIQSWRDLTDTQQEALLEVVGGTARFRRVRNSRPYSMAMYSYPRYLTYAPGHGTSAPNHDELDALVADQLASLKLATFDTEEEWIAYLGDPEQRPTWYTWLTTEVTRAESQAAATELVIEHADQLSEDEQIVVEIRRREKAVEDFFSANLSMLEAGLTLVDDGRQFITPIGRIDLLCVDAAGQYVVVEIKWDEAADGVFGQILRYIGWVHRNMPNGQGNVRGIILAGGFAEKARYSRIGLLKPDYREFLAFKEHGLNVADA